MRKNTEMIIKEANALLENIYNGMFTDKEVDKAVKKGKKNREELKKILEDVVVNSPTLRDYVNNYIYINKELNSSYSSYMDIGEEESNSNIIKTFEENGYDEEAFPDAKFIIDSDKVVEGADESVQKVINTLDQPAVNIDRISLFAVAFGMNMDVDETEHMLEKVLLQQGFNSKDYREVIYWWCLKGEFSDFDKIKKCAKVKEYFTIYENEDKLKELVDKYVCQMDYSISDNTNTILLTNEMKKIKTEGELFNYLYNLKKANLKRKNSLNLSMLYNKLLHGIPRSDEFNAERLSYYLWQIFAGVTSKEMNDLVDEIGEEYEIFLSCNDNTVDCSKVLLKLKEIYADFDAANILGIKEILGCDYKKLEEKRDNSLITNSKKKKIRYENDRLKDYLYEMISGRTKSYVNDLAIKFFDDVDKVLDLTPGVFEQTAAVRELRKQKVVLNDDQINRIQDLIWEEDRRFSNEDGYSREDIIRSVAKHRANMKENVEEGLYEGELLPKEVLKPLFDGIVITEKGLRLRMNPSGSSNVTRKELLFAYFLERVAWMKDEEKEDNISRKENVEDFEDEASEFLKENHMHPIYKRNPFDLFLIICLMYDDPFKYIMANWATIEMKTSKK